jgi:hypothetical protein
LGLALICRSSIAERPFVNHRRRLSNHARRGPIEKRNAIVKGSFESGWVGFISGLNISGERDIVGGGDF